MPDKRLGTGSPPQVRGKPRRLSIFRSRYRITPAGAGKTKKVAGFIQNNRDHPRRCGENGVKCCKMRLYVGSPPQVRGKPSRRGVRVRVRGITPAGAGKTGRKDRSGVSNEDHPRRCGENFIVLFPYGGTIGSPPQVRGKLLSD